MNRIDEFADAFQGWLAEWYSSRKLAGGGASSLLGVPANSCGADRKNGAGTITPKPTPDCDGASVPAPAGMYRGDLVERLAAMTQRVMLDRIKKNVLAAHRVIDRLSLQCPQGVNCVGDGKPGRLFECDCCGEKMCVPCLAAHDSEPHWSDSLTTLERHKS